jgi:tryptophan-rich sensory protein
VLIALWPLDLIAFVITAPYLVWVTVAGALNLSLWMRNRTTQPA